VQYIYQHEAVTYFGE